jgi:transmembrane sensor
MKQNLQLLYRRFIRYWKALVVSALLLLIDAGKIYFTNHPLRLGTVTKPTSTPLEPGHYEELVTLNDGGKQMLDSTGITEPFQITLPDGTKVRLGYGSSLRYPPEFTGDSREVSVSGLADFEVARDVKRPFVLHTPRTSVWVLGTHFNVADYPEEPTAEVTLLDGKVKVQYGSEIELLKVGEQAIVKKDRMEVQGLEHSTRSIGWAGGDPYLNFENTNLNTALQRVARWYHVKILNLELAHDVTLTGWVWLMNPLAGNLKVMEEAENHVIHMDIKGGAICLSPGKPH